MKNPFSDEPVRPRGPRNPFADPDGLPDDPAATIEHASARIRRLKGQVGSDGLTLAGTRELLDQISIALDSVARALRKQD